MPLSNSLPVGTSPVRFMSSDMRKYVRGTRGGFNLKPCWIAILLKVVMDPVSAAGLASSIITSIDFSTKLVKGSYDLYKTGGNEQHGISRRRAWVKLRELAGQCEGLAAELSMLLDDFKLKFGVESKSMCKEKKIANMEQKLNSLRGQVLLMVLSEGQASLKAHATEVQTEGVRLSVAKKEALAKAQDETNQICKRNQDEVASQEYGSNHTFREPMEEIRTTIAGFQLRVEEALRERTSAQNSILRRLCFSSMYSRGYSVSTAGSWTFEWLLDGTAFGDETEKDSTDSGPHSEDWSCKDASETSGNSEDLGELVQNLNHSAVSEYEKSAPQERDKRRHQTSKAVVGWLQNEDNLYHISGKAGAGKSTLKKVPGQHRTATSMTPSLGRGEEAGSCQPLLLGRRG
ncbi:hypothetical protein MCOR23_006562 [Pyricularia oryzae]|nr:hypothetical protein MCOR34_007212 [Pyricularia oryzae]KAI6339812.1 hypothetical protein MCOR28_007012 [Pyricularia oryzae]KAI6396593.1 hypothetical protein MCOR23_006562 [Pyricularia oryzae]